MRTSAAGGIAPAVSAAAVVFGPATYGTQKTPDKEAVSARSNDHLAVGASTHSGEHCVCTRAEHRPVRPGGEGEHERVPRETVPADKPQPASGRVFGHREPRHGCSLAEAPLGGSSWFGGQHVRKDCAAAEPRPRELHGQSAPHRGGVRRNEHLVLVNERQVLVQFHADQPDPLIGRRRGADTDTSDGERDPGVLNRPLGRRQMSAVEVERRLAVFLR